MYTLIWRLFPCYPHFFFILKYFHKFHAFVSIQKILTYTRSLFTLYLYLYLFANTCTGATLFKSAESVHSILRKVIHYNLKVFVQWNFPGVFFFCEKLIRSEKSFNFHFQSTYFFYRAAVVEWLSSWLAEQEVRGSIPGLAT